MAATPPICNFGWHAVDFDLPATDGKRYRLAQLQGPKGLLVMFICNHCPYVKAVIDRIVRDCKELKEHGIASVAISANDPTDYPEDSFDNMKRVAEKLRFPFPYLWDESQQVARAYDAVCTPDFFGFNQTLELQYRAARCFAYLARARRPTRPVRGDAKGGTDWQGAGRADLQHGLLHQVEATAMSRR